MKIVVMKIYYSIITTNICAMEMDTCCVCVACVLRVWCMLHVLRDRVIACCMVFVCCVWRVACFACGVFAWSDCMSV